MIPRTASRPENKPVTGRTEGSWSPVPPPPAAAQQSLKKRVRESEVEEDSSQKKSKLPDRPIPPAGRSSQVRPALGQVRDSGPPKAVVSARSQQTPQAPLGTITRQPEESSVLEEVEQVMPRSFYELDEDEGSNLVPPLPPPGPPPVAQAAATRSSQGQQQTAAGVVRRASSSVFSSAARSSLPVAGQKEAEEEDW